MSAQLRPRSTTSMLIIDLRRLFISFLSPLRCQVILDNVVMPEQSVFCRPYELCQVHFVFPACTHYTGCPRISVFVVLLLYFLLILFNSLVISESFNSHHMTKQAAFDKLFFITVYCTSAVFNTFNV